MSEELTVELGERSYPIWIGSSVDSLAPRLSAALPEGERKFYVLDEKVAHYAEALPPGEHYQVPSGENSKSFQQLEAIHDALAALPVSRQGAIVAIGGGVVGDLAGFAAATYLRGIRFYQVPTTLLAMVDSSVGGKTGVNIAAGKNLAGAFWQPRAVFICTGFLQSLPPREFSAGMAEVIKYGMLYDRSLFEQLEQFDPPLQWDHPQLPGVIRRCCEIKAEIVQADEMETADDGGRALLNLGHTFAHAIEKVAGYGTYLHGEAVAIGLAMASRLSNEISGTDFTASNTARVERLLKAYQLPPDLRTPLGRGETSVEPPSIQIDPLIEAMFRDKKVRSGKLRFVAMERLGKAVTIDGVEEALIRTLWADVGAI